MLTRIGLLLFVLTHRIGELDEKDTAVNDLVLYAIMMRVLVGRQKWYVMHDVFLQH